MSICRQPPPAKPSLAFHPTVFGDCLFGSLPIASQRNASTPEAEVKLCAQTTPGAVEREIQSFCALALHAVCDVLPPATLIVGGGHGAPRPANGRIAPARPAAALVA